MDGWSRGADLNVNRRCGMGEVFETFGRQAFKEKVKALQGAINK